MRFTKSVNLQKSVPEYEKPNTFGMRHVQALLMLFGMAIGFSLRVNISVALVPMTKPSIYFPYYDWDTTIKSYIFSSFFWGYVIAQVPSGLLAKRFGGKIVLGIATLLASVITLLHPWAASVGNWQFMCVLRGLIGLTQGTVFPSMHTLLAKWAPRTERSFLCAAVYSGAQLGIFLTMGTSGALFDSSLGWPGFFYVSGAATLAWSLLFLLFGADSPQKAKMISIQEREYIEGLTGGDNEKNEPMNVPWKSILTSPPLYGLIAAHSGSLLGYYTLLNQIPTYMDKVLKLNVASNALLSALPYFVMWLLCLIISPISDMLINRNVLSTTAARKLFNTIGLWIPMVALIGLGYMTSEEGVGAITLITIGVSSNAAVCCGYLVNHIDLSPNFAGTLMSITNGMSNLLSVIAPLVVGAVLVNEEDPTQWRFVFFITAGVYLVCNIFFLIFGDATIQAWNNPTNSNNNAKSLTFDASITEKTE